MSRPGSWADLLSAPVFLVNLDRSPDRFAKATARIRAAGFSDVRRWSAADGQDAGAMQERWKALPNGPPRFDPAHPEFLASTGAQGCALSHLELWSYIASSGIPYAVILEDDIAFHPRWAELGPIYLAETPADWDMLYLGGQPNQEYDWRHARIASPSLYCTHAYAITAAGAARMLAEILGRPAGIYTIDNQITEAMRAPSPPIRWYLWNTMNEPADGRSDPGERFLWRNAGMVWQDWHFDTTIRAYF